MKITILRRYATPYLFILLFLLPLSKIYGQTAEEIKRLDEINKELGRLVRQKDSVDKIAGLQREYRGILSHSKSFYAFTIGYERSRAEIRSLNADMQSKNFTPLKDGFGAIVFGYSRMNKRVTGNLLFNVVPGNKASNMGYEISLRGAGAAFDKGYAFISTPKLIFHAFAGIGWQYYTIKQTEKNSTSAAALFDLLPNSKTGKVSQDIFHGSLGMQFDYNLFHKPSSNFGMQAGIRFAYNPVLIKGKHKYGENDSKYQPGVDWRQYNLSILFKLFGKTYFRR